MEQKNEISEHTLLSLERQTARLIEIIKVAIIIVFTALLSIPVFGSLLGVGNSGHYIGLSWSSAWMYGLLAVYGVNYWWSYTD